MDAEGGALGGDQAAAADRTDADQGDREGAGLFEEHSEEGVGVEGRRRIGGLMCPPVFADTYREATMVFWGGVRMPAAKSREFRRRGEAPDRNDGPCAGSQH